MRSNNKLVIDINIIVSALLSEDSKAFKVLSDALDGKYTVLISEEIFQAYQDVLHRDKFGFDEEIISFFLAWFRENDVSIRELSHKAMEAVSIEE